MSALADRRLASLDQKMLGLHAEFDAWLGESAAGGLFARHHSQIIALTGHLEGLRTQTQALLDEIRSDGSVLSEGQNIETLILGIRRIWEFFRVKLVQRRDDSMRAFLQVADEIAWLCYKPVLDLYPQARRQPPLVFLNGGLSPFALSRDQAFTAESVPGEGLAGPAYRTILQSLPIPLIGVPWSQLAHLPDLPVIAHETGHAVESDFDLHDSVAKNLSAALAHAPERLSSWLSWSHEIFADLWGCLTLGVAYASSLADFLAVDRQHVANQIAGDAEVYPTNHLRIMLACEALMRMGFKDESAALADVWHEEYSATQMKVFEADVPGVIDAILGQKLVGTRIEKPLLESTPLRFKETDQRFAREGADQLIRLPSSTSISRMTHWVAAARLMYDRSPANYIDMGYGAKLLKVSSRLVDPRTRSAERVLSPRELEQLKTDSAKIGRATFDAFSRTSIFNAADA